MPARLLVLWSCSLFSAMGGSLYLHLKHLGCWHGRSAALKKAKAAGCDSAAQVQLAPVVPSLGSDFRSGDAVDCSKLLLRHNDVDREAVATGMRKRLSRDLDSVWADLVRDAPSGSIFLDAGSNASSIPMKNLVDSEKSFSVHLFRPELSQQLDACDILSRGRGERIDPSSFQIYPIQAGEREDFILPARQLQTSFDTFASDQGWFGPNDDRQQTLNGVAVLRGSLAKTNAFPIVQALSISGDNAYRNSRILKGAIELLNRHYVRNVLVSFAFNSDQSANEDRERLRRGMHVLDDAGYHVHQTIDRSSDAGHQLTVWWKL
jgi:hypothetical protein